MTERTAKPLKWGMVGGGEGSQIGPLHRMAARLDGLFDFCAGALDGDPAAGKAYGQVLGLDDARSYGDWREMLAGEQPRADRPDLITIATPNNTHFEMTRAFLQAGFHVLCEKPMTMTVAEAQEIVRISFETGKICAVNYGYSGFALVREMRAMVLDGKLGKVRLVVADFAHGHHADAADADNPRVRWRYDPAQIGVSAQFADCGIHALHLAGFITGQQVTRVSADLASTIASRALEDDAMVNFRLSDGAVGRLWTSAVAIGRQHGLAIQVFGETGGLRWSQEHPDQLFYMPLGGRLQVIERGEEGLSDIATDAWRMTIGHAEGLLVAFANIYSDLHGAIGLVSAGGKPRGLYPTAEDGLRSMAAIYAVAESGKSEGAWQDLVISD